MWHKVHLLGDFSCESFTSLTCLCAGSACDDTALEPYDPTVLCNLGNLKREQQDDLASAESYYRRALAADPGHVQVEQTVLVNLCPV